MAVHLEPVAGLHVHLLFLCVANSARSQMAEGLARARFGDRFTIRSAGSMPSIVNPYAIEVMQEIGVDLGGHRSKSVLSLASARVETVVTLCEDEVCPAFLAGARMLRWPIADPAIHDRTLAREEMTRRFRRARDTIRAKLDHLAFDLAA